MSQKLTTILCLLLIVCSFQNTIAQRIRFDKDKMEFLNTTEKVNVVFVYDSLVYDPEVPEAQFLIKMQEKIVKHGDAEMAQQFMLDYPKAKFEEWPNTFVTAVNQWSADYKNAPTFVVEDTTAKYTMKVHTRWLYFGYDAGIVDQPAKATMDIYFYKTEAPDTIIETTTIRRAMGTYNNKDGDGEEWPKPNLSKMAKAFDKAGFKFAKAIRRVVD